MSERTYHAILIGNMVVNAYGEQEMIALSCPSCGAPIRFGMGSCGHCGSGLMRKVGDETSAFAIPNDAREMKVGIDFPPNADLPTITRIMEQQFSKNGCGYVVWKNVPVFVGLGITSQEARANFASCVRQRERDALGSKWTRALKRFGLMLHRIESLDVEQRMELGDRYFATWGEDRLLPSTDFFKRPSLDSLEPLMECYVGRDDAETLTEVVRELDLLLS